ncbi:hypothetical protein, partial [Kitasatospora nipponensis]
MSAKGRVAEALRMFYGLEGDPATLHRLHAVRCPAGRPLYTVWLVPGHGRWVAGQVRSTRTTVDGEATKSMFTTHPLERVIGREVEYVCQCHPTRSVRI